MTEYPVVQITLWFKNPSFPEFQPGYYLQDCVRFPDEGDAFSRSVARLEETRACLHTTLEKALASTGFARSYLFVQVAILKTQEHALRRLMLLRTKERIHVLLSRKLGLVVRSLAFRAFHTMRNYEEARIFKNLSTATNLSIAFFETDRLTDECPLGVRTVDL